MNNLKFKYLSAENFVCFGSKGIELDLTKMDNIVFIRGDNLDVKDEEERIASNGVGKSTIIDIIVYTLYGKMVKYPKKLNHKNVINNKIKKKLRTEIRWDDYRLVRTRKPDSLRLWKSPDGIWDDSTEESLGGMPATQKFVEELIGLSYEAFVNIVVFTDNNLGSFLECDTEHKREIIENLLLLDIYKELHKTAKDLRNEVKEKMLLFNRTYEHSLIELEACKKRILQVIEQEKQWENNKKSELNNLLQKLELKKKELEKSDIGNQLIIYNNAQEEISNLNDTLTKKEEEKLKLTDFMNEIQSKLDISRNEFNSAFEKYNLKNNEINQQKSKLVGFQENIKNYQGVITKKSGKKCDVCHEIVKPENFSHLIEHNEAEASKTRVIIDELIPEVEILQKEAANKKNVFKQIEQGLEQIKSKVSSVVQEIPRVQLKIKELCKIQKPETGLAEKVINQQIEDLTKQVTAKRIEVESDSPFVNILISAKQEYKDKTTESEKRKKDAEEVAEELPYYEFFVKAYGDDGIRKFVVDGIIPALNSRVQYWLQFLIDGKISLTFNNKLEETIERNPSDGDPFVYHAMSGGERRRLNLAVSQSFAYIMTLNSNISPSFVFLDEVTTNIDPIGVNGIYNMILELSQEKQVFITTHDAELLNMLQGCETINLVKKDGFTTRK